MLHAVIMAGGSGTRFWPKSRRDRPKQLLNLQGDETMLQQTVARIAPLVGSSRLWVITGGDQADATRAQLPTVPSDHVIAEPCPRDTAPCVGLAALKVAHADPNATMIVMPADHVIDPPENFLNTVRAADELVGDQPRTLVTFGVSPTRPDTGYGYIERGELLEKRREVPVYNVVQFREKPDRETAIAFLESGRFLWNAGIFVWRAQTILDAIAEYRPKLFQGLKSLADAIGRADEAEALARIFPELERVPIDKAVMEHATNVRVLEVAYNWNDVGDWRALATLLDADANGNAIQGAVVTNDTVNSILISDDGGLIATIGIDNLVVVHSGKATLVARKDQLDQLKALVESLRAAGHESYL
jgi:mannose-1-phosphate guanylyltransferase